LNRDRYVLGIADCSKSDGHSRMEIVSQLSSMDLRRFPMFKTHGLHRMIRIGIRFAVVSVVVGAVVVLGGVSVWLWCLVMQGG
jgi:hypothetical protein